MKHFIFLVALAAVIVAVTGCSRPQAEDRQASVTPDTAIAGESGPLTDGTYVLDAARSGIEWTGKKILIAGWVDHGTVGASSGTATIAGGEIASGTVTTDMTTIAVKTTAGGKDRGQDMLSRHLKSADFFDVEQFPTAVFTFTRSTTGADGVRTVDGDLTIRGITKPVSFPAVIAMDGDSIRLRGSMKLDRTAWDIKFRSSKFFSDIGDQVIDDYFTLDLDIVGTKQR